MSTYTRILYQIVFGSKYYSSFLTKENEKPLYSYMAGIISNRNCKPYIIGGYQNHVHIISSLHPALSLSQFIKDIKLGSGEFMKNRRALFNNFPGWQIGYGAFTYNYNDKKFLIDYVENQEEHHRKKSFKEELINFLEEFGIEYDEKYLLL